MAVTQSPDLTICPSPRAQALKLAQALTLIIAALPAVAAAGGGLAMSIWFLRHCREREA